MIPWILLILLVAFIFWGPETKGHDFGGGDSSVLNLVLFPFWLLWQVIKITLVVIFGIIALDAVKRRYRRRK